jgi:hypothetical protein
MAIPIPRQQPGASSFSTHSGKIIHCFSLPQIIHFVLEVVTTILHPIDEAMSLAPIPMMTRLRTVSLLVLDAMNFLPELPLPRVVARSPPPIDFSICVTHLLILF